MCDITGVHMCDRSATHYRIARLNAICSMSMCGTFQCLSLVACLCVARFNAMCMCGMSQDVCMCGMSQDVMLCAACLCLKTQCYERLCDGHDVRGEMPGRIRRVCCCGYRLQRGMEQRGLWSVRRGCVWSSVQREPLRDGHDVRAEMPGRFRRVCCCGYRLIPQRGMERRGLWSVRGGCVWTCLCRKTQCYVRHVYVWHVYVWHVSLGEFATLQQHCNNTKSTLQQHCNKTLQHAEKRGIYYHDSCHTYKCQ